jgi:threonine aldolase
MRQVGVLAAAGLIALRDGSDGMIDRLAEDHQNARRLAEGLVNLPGVSGLDPSRVRTNFVFFELPRAELRGQFLEALAGEGVLIIDATIDAARRALAAIGLAPQTVAVG